MTIIVRAAALCACAGLAACGGAATNTVQTLTVDVRVDGGGSARVVSSPPGIDCASGTCSAQFRRGTTVTLRSDLSPARFVRWVVGAASAGTAQEWIVSLDQDEAVTGVFASANYVFVTSSALDPASLTLASADAECAARALAAGLPGTYRAWLSTAAEDAASRLDSAGGWVRTDGLPFANTRDDLLAGRVYYPPRLDEFGESHDVMGVRTLTTPGGVFSSPSCLSGVLEIVGSPSGGPGTWTSAGPTDCMPLPVYCFGVDLTTAVTVPRAAGRLAFVSTATFASGGGLAPADAACALDASANGLPGTYRALLATSATAPTARFNLAGEPWVRPDGVAIVRSASDLAAASELLAPMAVGADGTYHAGGWTGLTAWTGVHNAHVAAPGTLDTTCDDWTLKAGGVFPTFGDVGETNPRYYAMGEADCGAPLHLYCLQQ